MAIPRFRTHFGSSTWTLAVSLLAILLLSMGSPRFATASFGCGAYMLCNDTECPDEEEAKTECEEHSSEHCSVEAITCREPEEDDPEQEYCLICIYEEEGGEGGAH